VHAHVLLWLLLLLWLCCCCCVDHYAVVDPRRFVARRCRIARIRVVRVGGVGSNHTGGVRPADRWLPLLLSLGTLSVLSRYSRGTPAVLSRYSRGTLTVVRWFHTATDVIARGRPCTMPMHVVAERKQKTSRAIVHDADALVDHRRYHTATDVKGRRRPCTMPTHVVAERKERRKKNVEDDCA
jgi:hypothetical protein